MSWTESEKYQLGVFAVGDSSVKMLRKAYLTGNETDDLMVVDPQSRRVQILFKEPNTDVDRISYTSETKFQNVDFAEAPSAVLPMRLNVMGQQGLVVFHKGNLEPTTSNGRPERKFRRNENRRHERWRM